MPRRKSLYRSRLAAETEYVCDAARPPAIPDGAPATVEVGMGAGKVLVARAAANPGRFFLGVELKEERTWQAVRAARELGLTNIRFLADHVGRIDALIPTGRFDELLIFFPDPWPRDRDEKRRLVSPQHLRLFARWLKPGARGVFRTDSKALFEYGCETLAAKGWTLLQVERDVPPAEVATRYETLWRKLELPIHQALFERPATLPDDPATDVAARPALAAAP
ncbi:MAG TPA: tRNA (guanosine(46)-N7)-methyltransferase TrmB [Planctomycetota bacterium]|nr:tRNA (guanosine(46)-N7)-methyltransferase TrmB [Planctomycetota bacterium]